MNGFSWKPYRKKLDKIMAASAGKQLILLLGVWVLICLIGWGVALVFRLFPQADRLESGGNELWWAFSRVLGVDYSPDVVMVWERTLVVALAFLGSMVLTGGVVSLFVANFTKRKESVQNGYARYPFKTIV